MMFKTKLYVFHIAQQYSSCVVHISHGAGRAHAAGNQALLNHPLLISALHSITTDDQVIRGWREATIPIDPGTPATTALGHGREKLDQFAWACLLRLDPSWCGTLTAMQIPSVRTTRSQAHPRLCRRPSRAFAVVRPPAGRRKRVPVAQPCRPEAAWPSDPAVRLRRRGRAAPRARCDIAAPTGRPAQRRLAEREIDALGAIGDLKRHDIKPTAGWHGFGYIFLRRQHRDREVVKPDRHVQARSDVLPRQCDQGHQRDHAKARDHPHLAFSRSSSAHERVPLCWRPAFGCSTRIRLSGTAYLAIQS